MSALASIGDAIKAICKAIHSSTMGALGIVQDYENTSNKPNTAQLLQDFDDIRNQILENSQNEISPQRAAIMEMVNDFNNSIAATVQDHSDPEKAATMLPNELIHSMAQDATDSFMAAFEDKEGRFSEMMEGSLIEGKGSAKTELLGMLNAEINSTYMSHPSGLVQSIGANGKQALSAALGKAIDGYIHKSPADKIGVKSEPANELDRLTMARENERQGLQNAREEMGPVPAMGGKGK